MQRDLQKRPVYAKRPTKEIYAYAKIPTKET